MAFTGLGAGTVGDPYQITTWAQFQEIGTNLAAHFKLMNDIDAANAGMSQASVFTGVLDGDGHSLINVTLLFSITGGTVQNINIKPTVPNTYSLFNLVDTAVFSNININSTTANTLPIANKISNSNITNLKAIANGGLYISYGQGHTTNIFTNCTFQSAISFIFDWSVIISDTFNGCKFIVTNFNRENILGNEMRACTFNNCLFYGHLYNPVYSTTLANRNFFNYTSFITNYNQTRTGSLTSYQGLFNRKVNGAYEKCYFGGQLNINHVSYTEGVNFHYRLMYETSFGAMTDCHFKFNLNATFDVPPALCKHLIIPDSSYFTGTQTRSFVDCIVSNEFSGVGPTAKNGTSCFINVDNIEVGVTNIANYTALTTPQTKQAANFPTFDFATVWEIEEGTTAPKLRNVIYSESAYRIDPAIGSISVARLSGGFEKLTINTTRAVPSESLYVYVSNSQTGLESPENRVSTTEISSILTEADLPAGEGTFYVLVKYADETFTTSGYHYAADQVAELTINVTAPNYAVLSNPDLKFLHGLIHFNGFIYGSARGVDLAPATDCTIFKIKADDYTVLSKQIVYTNKTGQLDRIQRFDQIVYCKGFLWAQSYGFLVRINPDDLDYIVFDVDWYTVTYNQPIGTDGVNLFVNSELAVKKLDADLLLGSFASYGYTGAAPVYLPSGALLGACLIVQNHPTKNVYSHSIAVDDTHVFIAATSTNQPNGYDSALGMNICHLQKIDKNTMVTAGSVTIPKCTDDMVQSPQYMFLAPELVNTTEPVLGADWGLLAVNKSTLEIKFLKALHQQFHTVNETDRQTYGVQYYGEKVMVNLVSSKKTVIVNTLDVESWGENFPIGGATEAVLNFQINGVAISGPTNELVLDTNEECHLTIWEAPSTIFKFSFSETGLVFTSTPLVTTSLISSDQTTATLGGNILSEGESPMTSGGFKWGPAPEALTNDLTADPFSYDFTEMLTELEPGIYYFKAYGTNTEGTFFGNVVMFSTYNAVSFASSDTVALLGYIDSHFGCSIRCVQDASGIPDGTTGTATDQDGNEYDTVVINGLRWMVQNLKTTKYQDGSPIALIVDNTEWANDEIGGRCTYGNLPLT